MAKKRDHSLELLIDLDGLNFIQAGGYWIKYEVSAVEKTPERPHGIKYSLTLHDPQGERIFGIDNAHRPKSRAALPPSQSGRRPLTICTEAGECTPTSLRTRKRY